MRKRTPPFITTLKPNQVFVFGSNLAGRHGKGAALQALQLFGAKYGEGVGHWGQSFAIPTKDRLIRSMNVEEITPYVKGFLQYAAANSSMEFLVTRVGCGLAAHADADIAPLFFGAPDNVRLPVSWITLEQKHNEAQKAAIAASGSFCS